MYKNSSLFNVISPTGAPSLYQVMTGVGLPMTSHTKLVDWLRTSDTLPGVSPSRKTGGTVEVLKVITELKRFVCMSKCMQKCKIEGNELVNLFQNQVKTKEKRSITIHFELVLPLSGSSIIDGSTDILSIVQW